MKLEETTQSDLDFMAKHSISRGCFKDQPKRLDYVYTLFHEDKLLGIGGIKLINKTTAWCWVDISSEAEGYMTLGYRVIKEWLEELVKTHELRRLMAAVEVDFPEAIRMIQHLGFSREYTMRCWKGNKSAHMYSRVFGDEDG